MNIGDYVQIKHNARGLVVEPPHTQWREYVWVLITCTPHGHFVGQTHPFDPDRVEVLSEGR